MPPFLPRKRLASTRPPESPRADTSTKRAKLADTLDAEPRNAPSLQAVRDFSLGDDSESSLSDVDSDEFEDVTPKPQGHAKQDQDEEDDIDWEDTIAENDTNPKHAPREHGDLQLTFSKNDEQVDYGIGATSGIKKGPSRRDKEVRMMTHKMHVQYLLYHNAVRNRWICDETVQGILVKQLPTGVKKEVERWKVASGLEPALEITRLTPSSNKGKRHGKRKVEDERSQRDWGKPSQRMEKGKPDLSRGDPIIPLMKVLSAYWKKKFAATAPGLRKRGYGTKIGLQQEIASYRNDPHNPERHGEKISNLEEFRDRARKCTGSRDVGAQLFTALLRGLGIESRLVASLQPSGFGFTKVEQAAPKKPTQLAQPVFSDDESDEAPRKLQAPSKESNTPAKNARRTSKGKGEESTPIDLDTSSGDEGLSEDGSIVDVTPSMPKQKPSKYDRDLPYPIYWTEAISPISHSVLPVSPLVLEHPVATTPEFIAQFEPRGAKADKAKQVMAYVIAYSTDGTAKDVTIRYLKKRMWPGKTKGFRVQAEQIPIRNARGKIKKYEEYDWFKTVMSGYVRPDDMRTPVDDVEDSSDLVSQQPEKKDKEEGDTLQSLKSSADLVLERFLRREEALKPNVTPVRMFVSGKGDKSKEEPVYWRADVERCLTTESWHKEGRIPKAGVAPLKQVTVRAVTLTRKREILEEERQTGQKPTQGLYSRDQTEWIIPPPIKDGKIPKNAYNNIDCFVPSMVPKGAVHIPWRGTVRICKKLEVDYAEAVTGFEFGNKMAIPVIQGVVVAVENEEKVKEAWKMYDAEQKKKEEGKLEKAVLALWRKFVMGLRIHERVQEDYGEEVQEPEPDVAVDSGDAGMSGGFFLPHEEEHASELVLEDHELVPNKQKEAAQYPTPMSMLSDKKKPQRRSLLHEGSESAKLSDLSSAIEDLSPSKSDVTEDGGASEDVYAPRSQRRARHAAERPKKEAMSKTPTTPHRGLRKSARSAITSPYFDRGDDDE